MTAKVIPFTPNPGQVRARAVLAQGQRHTLLVGGARSGKTFEYVRTIAFRALAADGSRHAIFRFRYNAVRASIWLDTWPKMMRLCFPGVTWQDRRQDGYLELQNGSEIWFGGTDDKERVEKLLGMEYATAYFNEASQIPYGSITLLRTRVAQVCPVTRGPEPGRALSQRVYYDLNPVGTGHWTHKLFLEGIDPETRAPIANRADYAHCFLNPADNAANLDPAFIAELEALPERQRRRFLDGLYSAEIDGQLWTFELIEQARVLPDTELPDFARVVVAVDPSGASGPEDKRSDEIGLVAGGLYVPAIIHTQQAGPFRPDLFHQPRSQAWLLDDASGRYSPEGWGTKAIAMYRRHRADAIIAEANYGGDMVRHVIHSIDPNVPVRLVNATRGKSVRAEPVAALYEQGLVRHVGRFPVLEDQLTNYSTSGYTGHRSPDRADAWIWAATDLLIDINSGAGSAPLPINHDHDAADWFAA